MEKLSTIQKRENLNSVYPMDEIGPGGAHHMYAVEDAVYGGNRTLIQFQKGPRNEASSDHGRLDTDLLEIVRDRMKGFQTGEYATRENAVALTHIEEALLWMNKRVEDRIERNVLGTYNK